ncbi:hypothetical protein scyTo_0022740 [Scyliorhinus torazame]|uniref:Uncharacterized protein n=1 Tax=Scyliorhinus torazame TaxID=75743 RepID=A0A401Q6K0_SCYTO|nr:hypothetical protein [Scyliorhinus torazame]
MNSVPSGEGNRSLSGNWLIQINYRETLTVNDEAATSEFDGSLHILWTETGRKNPTHQWHKCTNSADEVHLLPHWPRRLSETNVGCGLGTVSREQRAVVIDTCDKAVRLVNPHEPALCPASHNDCKASDATFYTTLELIHGVLLQSSGEVK